jgi:hypothetical protein
MRRGTLGGMSNSVRTMMATVQEIGFAFDYSAKRLNAFSKELSNDVETREQLERRSKLIVVHALDSLQGTRAKLRL